MNFSRLLVKSVLFCFALIVSGGVSAYETVTTGEGFASNKDDACKQASDRARESAAQEARVFISSRYESRIQVLSGEVVENVTSQTYQSTFGITSLEEKISEVSKYHEDSGRISCFLKARFLVDAESVKKELEARVREEEEKIKVAKRRSGLMVMLEANEKDYERLKDIASEYVSSMAEKKVVCTDRYTMSECKEVVTSRFEKEKIIEISKVLNIPSEYVTVVVSNFDGKSNLKEINGDDSAFYLTMNGDFRYDVFVSDPYIKENQQIINKLRLDNHQNTNYKVDNERSHEYQDRMSWFSDAVLDVRIIKSDFIDDELYVSQGDTEAFIDSLIELGLVFGADGYSSSIYRLYFLTGKLNLHTCLVGSGDKCFNALTATTNVTGLGLEKIRKSGKGAIYIGGAYLAADDGQVAGTDFLLAKMGFSTNPQGAVYFYGDINLISPLSSAAAGKNYELSVSFSAGVGKRF